MNEVTILACTRRASEGKTVEVDYRGNVDDTMLDVLGGLRSACTYVSAGKIKEMPKRTTFVRVTPGGGQMFYWAQLLVGMEFGVAAVSAKGAGNISCCF